MMHHSRLSLLLALLALTGAAQAADTVPLQIELPKPLFAGTPRPISLPNLEKPRTGKRPDLMVPAGTVNLSKGKTVTSSDSLPVIGELTFITDGDKSGTDGTYVELGPTPQWVQIDLGAPAKVAAVVAWHFHSQARVYHDVIVQVFDEPHTAGTNARERAFAGSYLVADANNIHWAMIRAACRWISIQILQRFCSEKIFGKPTNTMIS